jgi:hypothetical protein
VKSGGGGPLTAAWVRYGGSVRRRVTRVEYRLTAAIEVAGVVEVQMGQHDPVYLVSRDAQLSRVVRRA